MILLSSLCCAYIGNNCNCNFCLDGRCAHSNKFLFCRHRQHVRNDPQCDNATHRLSPTKMFLVCVVFWNVIFIECIMLPEMCIAANLPKKHQWKENFCRMFRMILSTIAEQHLKWLFYTRLLQAQINNVNVFVDMFFFFLSCKNTKDDTEYVI